MSPRCAAIVLPLLGLFAGSAGALPPEDPLEPLYRRAAADLARGGPLVATVHVALCDNQTIHCGGGGLGNGDRPAKNLYWGGAAGLRAVFDRAAGWRRILLDGGDGATVLERVVYRRQVRAPSWRWRALGVKRGFDLVLVGLAYRGAQIGQAHRRFIAEVVEGRGLLLRLGQGQELKAGGLGHLSGYAGHNHLLDVVDFPWPAPRRRSPFAYFALSCLNASYFGPRTCRTPSRAVLLTRSLMYPGSITIEALLRAFAEATPQGKLFQAGVAGYARMQKRPERRLRAAFTHDREQRFLRSYPDCGAASVAPRR